MNESRFELTESEIGAIIGFLGYGRVSAPVWFIGLEEGLGDMTSEENVANVRARRV